MHSLARAVLVLLPLGARAPTSTRPARAPREMTRLVAATSIVPAAAIPPAYAVTHHWTP